LHAAPSSEPWRGQAACRRKNGEPWSAECSITTLRDAAAEVTGFWITQRDTTRLKRPTGVVCEAEANLSALIDSTNDLVWSVDLDYRLLTFNNALRDDVLSRSAVQVAVGMRPEDWMPPERAALWPPMFARALSDGPFRIEYPVLSGRTLELSLNPIRQNGRAVGISVFGKDITERKRRQDALREAEAKYRHIFDSALEGIYRNTLQGRSLEANPALAKMLGYDSPQDFVSTVTDVAHQVWLNPQDRSRCLQLLEPHGFVRGYECQFKRKDGTAVWVSVNIRRVGCPDEQAAYYEGFIEDINDRKRTAEALRKSEEKFAKAFLCSPAVMVLTDSEDRLLEVSEAFVGVAGYQRDEVIGRTIQDLRLWSDPHEFDAYRTHLRTYGGIRNMEFHFHRRNGELATGLISGESIELDGKTCRIAAILDITERKEAENQYREIFEGAQEGIYRTSIERKFVAANSSMARMLGYDSPQELVSSVTDTNAQLGLDPNDRIRSAALLGETGSVRGVECRVKRKDGTPLWASINARQVNGPDGRALFYDGFVQDITAQKAMQDAVRKSEEQFAIAFKSGPAMTAIFRPDEKGNRIIDVNEAFEQNTGYLREEVIGHTSQEVNFWADPGELDEAMNTLRAHGRVRNFKYHFRKKTGEIRIGLLSTTSIELDGKACAISTTIDITEQEKAGQAIQQANEAVATAERHYRLMFNSVSDALFVHKFGDDGLPSHFIEVNDNACRSLGYTREELLQMGPSGIDASEDQSEVPVRAQRIRAEGHLIWEGTHLAKDGRRIPVEVNTHLVDLDGSPTLISSVRDISDRIHAEESLRASEERHGSIVQAAMEGFWLTNAAGRFLEVNHAYCRMSGYSASELLTMCIADLVDNQTADETAIRMKRLMAQGEARFESRHRRKDGSTFDVEASVQYRPVEGGRFACFLRDITERKLADKKLLESEERFRSLFENATVGIYRTTPNGTIDLANPTLLRMLGYESFSALAERNLEESGFEPSYSRSAFRKALEDQGTIRGLESAWTRRDGSSVIVLESARCVKDETGVTAFYEGIVEDITERKRMQDALRKSEETFAKAFLSNPAIGMLFYLEEEANRIADVNEAFEQATGYRREEVVGRISKELGLWVDPGKFNEYRNLLQTDGRVRNLEFRFYKKTGEIRTGLMYAESLVLEGKTCVISTTIDITEQKKAEQARTTLVTAIEQASETIVITDLTGTIQYCNPAFEKVTGYSKEEAIGQNPRILKSGKHGKEFYEELWATITQGSVWTGHLINKKKDGSLYEEDATISPIRETSGKIYGFVAVKRDVTERIQLEDQLRQAQRLESIGRLAGGVAHDFNNLLTVINGYSGFLLKRLKAGDPLRSYAEQIATAGERAASLTKQLLAFSRKQVIEPRILDLNAIIRESTVMLRRLIGDDIVLGTHLDSSLGQVMADPDQIHQVIMNLAVNSRDAMPEGGTLDIQTLNFELTKEDGAAGRPGRDPGRYVLMTVTDTGHGMDETIRKQVFEPFFTTKGVGKGTGLGLSTVYGIIRQSGGWIDVSSEVGIGTAFKLYLPRIDACAVPEEIRLGAATGGGSETVLVAEDQEAVRSLAGSALKHVGYRVIEASDGNDAMTVAGRYAGEIHLLLTDVVMPGMDGKELSERLKKVRPNLKVLFISGYTADVIAERGVLERGVAFLHKPFSPEELAQKVREVLADPAKPRLES